MNKLSWLSEELYRGQNDETPHVQLWVYRAQYERLLDCICVLKHSFECIVATSIIENNKVVREYARACDQQNLEKGSWVRCNVMVGEVALHDGRHVYHDMGIQCGLCDIRCTQSVAGANVIIHVNLLEPDQCYIG